MSQAVSFARLLRPVGQILEPMQLETFSLRIESGGVAVHGEKRETKQASPRREEISLRVVWQALRRKKAEPAAEPQPSCGVLELHYTADDIARAEREGQAQRKAAGGTPEAHALSQILRAVGGYVDQKGGRLTAVTKGREQITIEYDSARNEKVIEQFAVASLYDYWVKMYMRRKQRP
jgi:hypothetical protein